MEEDIMPQRLELTEITIGTEIPFDDQIELPDGTIGHFHVENPVVDNEGKVIGFVVSFHEGDDHDHGDHDHDHHDHDHSH
jgi:hypothetical protein